MLNNVILQHQPRGNQQVTTVIIFIIGCQPQNTHHCLLCIYYFDHVFKQNIQASLLLYLFSKKFVFVVFVMTSLSGNAHGEADALTGQEF